MNSTIATTPKTGIYALIMLLQSFMPSSSTCHAQIIAFGKTLLVLPVTPFYDHDPIALYDAFAERVRTFKIDLAEHLVPNLIEEIQAHMIELRTAWAEFHYQTWVQDFTSTTIWQRDKVSETNRLKSLGVALVDFLEKHPTFVSALSKGQVVQIYHTWAGKVCEMPFDGADVITADISRLLGIAEVPVIKVLLSMDDHAIDVANERGATPVVQA